jgi:hypothetical protein
LSKWLGAAIILLVLSFIAGNLWIMAASHRILLREEKDVLREIPVRPIIVKTEGADSDPTIVVVPQMTFSLNEDEIF